VASGQKVLFGKLNAIVPQAGFKIEKRKIRGVLSEGMICSDAELELGDDKSGIMVLPDSTEVGVPLSEYYKLDDIIFDISLTPNRSDCTSHLGIARDLAAYLGTGVKKPVVALNESDADVNESLEVVIEDKQKCPRYTARVVRGIEVKESPEWLKNRLVLIGLRPINVIVDITNFVLMECGQPLHAFDLDKMGGRKIIVKTANDGEKFTTLDEKERKLTKDMLMICDAEKSVAIGGVMGGANSEISSATRDIVVESAYFNTTSVRMTSKKLGIQSDASYRFERGVDVDNVAWASDRAAALIAEIAGGTVEKGIIDVYPEKIERKQCTLRYKRATDIIGDKVSKEKIDNILESLNFAKLSGDENSITVQVPSYRVDVSLEIDLVEEVARMYSYDNIEPDYSFSINFSGERVPAELSLPIFRSKFRDYFVNNGAKQIITQNIIDPASAAIFTDNPVKISNPLGEELSLMRPSLVPSMLKTIERNIRVGNNELRFFEIGKSFNLGSSQEKAFIEGVNEKEELIYTITGGQNPYHWSSAADKADYYDIRGIFNDMVTFFGFEGIKLEKNKSDNKAFSKNSMIIKVKKEEVGILGEISSKLLDKFDIEVPVFAFIIDLDKFYKIRVKNKKYKPVSPFPAMNRDLAFVVNDGVEALQIQREIENKGGKLLQSVEIFDLYKGKALGDNKKSIAFSLMYSSADRTLVDKEVEESIEKIVKSVGQKFGAEIRK